MGNSKNEDAILTLKTLRNQHANKLAQNPDFQAIQALDRAIEQLSGTIASNGGGGIVGVIGRLSQSGAARKLILERNEPISARHLLDGILGLGVQVGGKNPLGNLVSILSGSGKFKSVSWKGRPAWWVADKPVPTEEKSAS
jgi:hypothetical protein